MTTATVLAINILLAVLFFGLTAGIPIWTVLKYPDEKGRPTR
jgi:hypothetical protein